MSFDCLAPARVDVAELLRLYDESRFLDAYALVRGAWPEPALVDGLTVPELVHGGRLAFRLGGQKLRLWLFDRAYARAPADPLVRYFCRFTRRRPWSLLDQLREYEAEPELATNDPSLLASWHASQAVYYATAGDFPRAHALVARALAVGAERAWTETCRAEVLMYEDRWEESLAAAEASFAASPNMPAAAGTLGRALARLGRLEEAARRLGSAAAGGQSWETQLVALWYQCTVAEREPPESRRRLAAQAYEMAARVETLAPLADRATRSQVAHARLDAALLMDDRERARRHAAEVRSPFSKKVVENWDANPEGRRSVLPYRPVFQKRMCCLPASLAAVLGCFGVHFDEDAFARALTYDGTRVGRAIGWLREQGYAVRPFVIEPALARKLLGGGLPFVYSTAQVKSTHATAAVGLDEASGTLIFHDPGSERCGQILLARMADEERPFGPLGLAVVPGDRAALLDLIPPEASVGYQEYLDWQEALEQGGVPAGAPLVEALRRRAPGSPWERRLAAGEATQAGDRGRSAQLLEGLVRDFPQNPHLRWELTVNLHRTHDTARIRSALEDVVKRGRLPGIQEGQEWRYAPATYVAQYADYLGNDATHFDEALALLEGALRREPYDGEAYHVLGDVLVRAGRHGESVLPYRLAATTTREDEHYARAAAEALRRAGREGEGVALLEGRVELLGRLVQGGQPWATLVAALEDWGRPDEAVAVMERALAARTDDPALAAFAAGFWCRQGRGEQAEAALGRVQAAGPRPMYHEAAVALRRAEGRWEEALELCRAWREAAPDSLAARSSWLELLALRDGRRAALDQAAAWSAERPGHEDLEDLHYEWLNALSLNAGAEALIRARVARNPDDGWAWRELAQDLLYRAELRPPATRAEVVAEADAVLATCVRLSPDSPATLALRARRAALDGDVAASLELVFRALVRDPSVSWCYGRIWEYARVLPDDEQAKVRARLEAELLRTVGPLRQARRFAFDLAGRLGFPAAEAAVRSWLEARPADPWLVEALVDLLLEYGQGQTDARRALELLEPAVARFPYHAGLRASLALAYRTLGRHDEELSTFRELLRRHPGDGAARRSLAGALLKRGQPAEAEALLAGWCKVAPLEQEAWSSLARFQWQGGRRADALATLEGGLARLPESVDLRQLAVERLGEAGDQASAVRVARGGVAQFPEGAFMWFLLAQAQAGQDDSGNLAEVEASLRRALELNAELWDAADRLAELLGRQRRFDEGRTVVRAILPRLEYAGPAHARLSWLDRQEGLPGALAGMAKVAVEWPLSTWAWWQLMEWAEADGEFALAREALQAPPPAAMDDPTFRARRLQVLERAGEPAAGLDEEWRRLLADFPDEEPLHLRRFDRLLERGTAAEAATVLEAIALRRPDSTYVLGRVAHLRAAQKAPGLVREAARRVFLAPGDDEGWPETTCWEALVEAEGASQAAAFVHGLLVGEGRDVRVAAVVAMAGQLSSAPEGPLRLQEVLAALDGREGDTARGRAAVLRALDGSGRGSLVEAYAREHLARCRRETPVWQAVGRAYAGDTDEHHRRVVGWMRDWRDHPGVEMWAVSVYLQALGEDLEERLASARDALRLLAPDNTLAYVAALGAEAALRLGRDEDFGALVARYGDLFRSPDERFWLPDGYRWAPPVVAAFHDLARATDGAAAGRAGAALQRAMDRSAPAWVLPLFRRRAAGRMSGWLRWQLSAGMWLRRALVKGT